MTETGLKMLTIPMMTTTAFPTPWKLPTDPTQWMPIQPRTLPPADLNASSRTSSTPENQTIRHQWWGQLTATDPDANYHTLTITDWSSKVVKAQRMRWTIIYSPWIPTAPSKPPPFLTTNPIHPTPYRRKSATSTTCGPIEKLSPYKSPTSWRTWTGTAPRTPHRSPTTMGTAFPTPLELAYGSDPMDANSTANAATHRSECHLRTSGS